MGKVERQANANLRLMGVEEYLRLAELGFFGDERLELIRGRVVRMAPMGREHADTLQLLTKVLVKAFGDLAGVRTQLPLLVSDDTMPEPDFALVDEQGTNVMTGLGGCLLAIDVSLTSLAYDRDVKATLYAEAKVPEYWLLNLKTRKLEVFSHPRGGRYTKHRVLSAGELIAPLKFPDVELKVASLFPAR